MGAIYLFALGPILITATVSFNSVNRSVFPPQGLSLRWWGEALDAKWTSPILFSLMLALAAAATATAIGVPAAFALVRREFRGKRVAFERIHATRFSFLFLCAKPLRTFARHALGRQSFALSR